jgi:hypothetical protein
VLTLTRGDLPFEVPGAQNELFLRMFLWSRLDESRRAALRAELQPLLPETSGTDVDRFLAAHQVFGWIGATDDAGLDEPSTLLAVLKKEDSSVYIGRRDTRQLLFLGYLDEILGLLSGRLLTQVLALRAG